VSRRYDWVFLDAGETLFQVADPLPEYGQILAHLGYTVAPDGLAALFRRARREALFPGHVGPPPHFAIAADLAQQRRERFVRALLDGIGVREPDRPAASEAIRESFVGTRLFGLYPDAAAVLPELRARGHRLGIISNWEPRLDILCHNHGIAPHFDFVLASEAEGFAKPGPRLFQRALELAGSPPERAVHVGDSFEHDVLGARAVGIAAVLLDRGGYYPIDEWHPTISSLEQLPGLL
jgi:putative hydrolase of the HAD superfamily